MTTGHKTIEQWGDFYLVSTRTVNRMKADGIDLADASAVAVWLASRRTASPDALRRVVEILDVLPQPQIT